MNIIKQKQISAELARNVSEILANEARDELLKTITITGAEVSKDLSYAKVYFTSISSLSKEQLEKELEESSGFVRTEIANRMNLRKTPIIKFIYDESVAYGNKIEHIIKEIHNHDN